MRSSVRLRITLVATALIAAALVFASWFVLTLVERDLLDATQRALDAELELDKAAFAPNDDLVFFDFVAAGRPLGLSVFRLGDEGVALGDLYEADTFVGEIIIDLDGAEVLDVLDPATGFTLDDPELLDELAQVALEIEAIESATSQTDSFFVGAAARDEVDASLRAVRRALTVIVPILMAALGLLTWWLVGRALRPVGAMSDRVEAISTSSLDQRVPVPAGRDEINNLATVMNGMLDRLERGDQRQRQFAADASHELRSPLSTVKAAAEQIEYKPQSPRTESLASDIVAEADRMDRLIGDLLHLARSDEGRDVERYGNVDLGQVAADAAMGATVRAAPGLLVKGSADQLHRVVTNLVSNARRHAANEVIVSVTATNDGHVDLHVHDDGPGVPATDRARIFERFSRLDDARSRDKGGAGLGLALVDAIVASHQGVVHVDTSDLLGGARFTVRLPAAAR